MARDSRTTANDIGNATSRAYAEDHHPYVALTEEIPHCVICFRAPKTTNGHYANTGEDRMIADQGVVSRLAALLLLIKCAATISAAPMASAAPGNAQITVLYDAFGKTSTM
jgi:hypothetical protein